MLLGSCVYMSMDLRPSTLLFNLSDESTRAYRRRDRCGIGLVCILIPGQRLWEFHYILHVDSDIRSSLSYSSIRPFSSERLDSMGFILPSGTSIPTSRFPTFASARMAVKVAFPIIVERHRKAQRLRVSIPSGNYYSIEIEPISIFEVLTLLSEN